MCEVVEQKGLEMQDSIVLRQSCAWMSSSRWSCNFWLGQVCGFCLSNGSFGVLEMIKRQDTTMLVLTLSWPRGPVVGVVLKELLWWEQLLPPWYVLKKKGEWAFWSDIVCFKRRNRSSLVYIPRWIGWEVEVRASHTLQGREVRLTSS